MIILKENSSDHGNQVNKGTGMTFWSPFGFGKLFLKPVGDNHTSKLSRLTRQKEPQGSCISVILRRLEDLALEATTTSLKINELAKRRVVEIQPVITLCQAEALLWPFSASGMAHEAAARWCQDFSNHIKVSCWANLNPQKLLKVCHWRSISITFSILKADRTCLLPRRVWSCWWRSDYS